MSNDIKVIAFHLPQYHRIPENDSWWGEGFTEWTNVKKAKAYNSDQYQPRVPLNGNYYNLLDEESLKWQVQIAKDHKIYGFCFYHYWFNGHMLLEKPVEKYRYFDDDEKLPYCLCWANETWTKAWADKRNEVLLRQGYGGKKEWKQHFEYLLPFFKDSRYIKEENKPVLVIYRPEQIQRLSGMLNYWQKLAIENGFNGICFMYQQYDYLFNHGSEEKLFSYNIEYQPDYIWAKMNHNGKKKLHILSSIYNYLPSSLQIVCADLKNRIKKPTEGKHQGKVYDYDEVWTRILDEAPSTSKSIPCAFVDFDNTPRRKEKGTYFSGVTVEKFEKYFKMLLNKTKEEYKTEYLFIFAWNEWGEGGYLEPDEKNKYGYLDAIKRALD